MIVTHKDKIENLEGRYEEIEKGLARLAHLEEMMEKIVQLQIKKEEPEALAEGSPTSEESFDDSELARQEGGGHRGRRNENRWRGRHKISCPVFDGKDPISWLSRMGNILI